MSATARQMLKEKHTAALISIAPDASVFEALQLLAQRDIGAAAVMDNGRLVGIFSERDYARRIVLQGRTSSNTLVSEIMTARVHVISPDRTAEQCMALMTAERIRHLPVVENEQVIGMISIGDVVHATIADQQIAIDSLSKYVMGCSQLGCQ